MLKILLIDKNPLTQKELSSLISWEQEGFEVAKAVRSAQEAYTFLKTQHIDLIITDINLPDASGTELIRQLDEKKLHEACILVMSDCADFTLARQAFRLRCTDFLLKPLQSQELMRALQSVRTQHEQACGRTQQLLANSIISLLHGKFGGEELLCVQDNTQLSGAMRYIQILPADPKMSKLDGKEKRRIQKQLYERCRDFLQDSVHYAILDAAENENIYDTGLIYCRSLAAGRACPQDTYFQQLYASISAAAPVRIKMLVGKEVQELRSLSESYTSTTMMRSCLYLYEDKEIFVYEKEMQQNGDHSVICKEQLDDLIYAINTDNHTQIHKTVEQLFARFRQMKLSEVMLSMNIHYLMFGLIHLASEQNSELNQEEILRLLYEDAFDGTIRKNTQAHIARFACDYADYLMQLHRQVPSSTLHKIAQEIKTNYNQNLTLKDLGKKYHINSAYLGQLYRKQYGCSFKDSLSRFRIAKSEEFLLKTDKCIYEIATLVGYRDPDYFVSLFISEKGCTPARFRKQRMRVLQG